MINISNATNVWTDPTYGTITKTILYDGDEYSFPYKGSYVKIVVNDQVIEIKLSDNLIDTCVLTMLSNEHSEFIVIHETESITYNIKLVNWFNYVEIPDDCITLKKIKRYTLPQIPSDLDITRVCIKIYDMSGTLITDSDETIIIQHNDYCSDIDTILKNMHIGECVEYNKDNIKYIIELIDVINKNIIRVYENIDYSNYYKIIGNELFSEKKYSLSSSAYFRALSLIGTPNYDDVILYVNLCNNLSISNIKLQKYDISINQCDNALQFDKTNKKAIYLKAKSKLLQHLYNDALEVLHEFKYIYSSDQDIIKLTNLINSEYNKYNHRNINMCKRMINDY
jgi:hypothetical protein